jgi:L-aminopeptidase/D-esterase-like protein
MRFAGFKGAITDVPGVRIGHAQDTIAHTGVTVALFESGAMGAGMLFGSAASTRGFESLYPQGVPKLIHGVCFAGGSSFGLAATGGVQRYLRERQLGIRLDEITIPLVPTAILFDLRIGQWDAYPSEDMAYRACENAKAEVEEGNVGAGTGALVGKLFREPSAMAGGVGTASARLGDVVIGVLTIVNAFGDVRDPDNGLILAGARRAPDSLELADSARAIRGGAVHVSSSQNTTLSLVVTNAAFDPIECGMLARMASAGMARTITPIFTNYDGDVIIVLSLGSERMDRLVAGQLAADVVEASIVRGVLTARPKAGHPCAADLLAAGSNDA